jgi:membrane protease YdiL (CAAX protease family)
MARDKRNTVFCLSLALVAASLFIPLVNLVVTQIAIIPLRLTVYVLCYAALASFIVILNRAEGESLAALGLQKNAVVTQILYGIAIFAAVSIIFIAVPMSLGLGRDELFPQRQALFWAIPQRLILVGFSEELIFRGYVLGRIQRLSHSKGWAIIISSLLFGLWHFIGTGNPVQVLVTAIIGACFALPRMYVKNCSIVSVSLAHGLYDSLLAVLSWVCP